MNNKTRDPIWEFVGAIVGMLSLILAAIVTLLGDAPNGSPERQVLSFAVIGIVLIALLVVIGPFNSQVRSRLLPLAQAFAALVSRIRDFIGEWLLTRKARRLGTIMLLALGTGALLMNSNSSIVSPVSARIADSVAAVLMQILRPEVAADVGILLVALAWPVLLVTSIYLLIRLGGQRQRHISSAKILGSNDKTWQYDFVEHFHDAEQIPPSRDQAERLINVQRRAVSGNMAKDAIIAQPLASANSRLRFHIRGIPIRIQKVRLTGYIGVLSQLIDLETGKLMICGFPGRPDNQIGFVISTPHSDVRYTVTGYGWIPIENLDPLTVENGEIHIELRTDALGIDTYNWAAWGELKLHPVME